MNKVHLVSYPRSGNTWVRFLLANIQHPKVDIGYRELDKLMPDSHQGQSYREEDITWSPVVFKSHSIIRDDYEKVIYLYRDGRDVALSCYRFYQGAWNNDEWRFRGTFTEYLEKFIKGWNNFGGWAEHVNFWVIRQIPKMPTLLVRYEDLIDNTIDELLRITEFLGLECGYRMVRDSIEKSAYAKLKARAPGDGQHPFSSGIKGTYGGWQRSFNRVQKEMFEHYAVNILKKLGY